MTTIPPTHLHSKSDDTSTSALLGTIAESPSTRGKLRTAETTSDKDFYVRQRFKLLDTAAKILPLERVAQCQRKLAPNWDTQQRIYRQPKVVCEYDPTSDTASYQNLVRCESYACPNCAYQRSENDRQELSIGLARAQEMGYFPLMLTLTLRHNVGDTLNNLREAVAQSFDGLFSGRWYQGFSEKYEVVGKVKVWETTYGKNGWHPHLHILMWLKIELIGKWLAQFEGELTEKWIEQLWKRGHDATWENGLNVRTGDSAIADYISKYGREPLDKSWGIDTELAKGCVKKAGIEGLTPFELLGAASGLSESLERFLNLTNETDEKYAKWRAGQLFAEYFYAFKGRPRIYWGSMRRILELDDAIAEFIEQNPRIESESQVILMIEAEDWHGVIKQNLQGELLIQVAMSMRSVTSSSLRLWLDQKEIRATLVERERV